jgi:hypothetical protein
MGLLILKGHLLQETDQIWKLASAFLS